MRVQRNVKTVHYIKPVEAGLRWRVIRDSPSWKVGQILTTTGRRRFADMRVVDETGVEGWVNRSYVEKYADTELVDSKIELGDNDNGGKKDDQNSEREG